MLEVHNNCLVSMKLLTKMMLKKVSNACRTHKIKLYSVASKYVTGSAKRYTNVHTMIFLYKRCYSNIFYSLNIFLGGIRYLQLFAYTHAKFEELNVLLTGQARSLKTAT